MYRTLQICSGRCTRKAHSKEGDQRAGGYLDAAVWR
jgi:hypothetical protein